jgi:hypothetical protein
LFDPASFIIWLDMSHLTPIHPEARDVSAAADVLK